MACHCFAQIEVLSSRPPQVLSIHLAAAYCFLVLCVEFTVCEVV